MLQLTDFKAIKNKQIKTLYQNVWTHLDYIRSLHSESDLLTYQEMFKAYKNGYASNKMFKALMKSQIDYTYIYVDWFSVYINAKLTYLNKTEFKRIDDLLKFAELQSTTGFLFLITDKLAKHHIQMINLLSKIDIVSYILLNDHELLKKQIPHYPKQLLEDFDVSTSLEGVYMINEGYLALWRYLSFKVDGWIVALKPYLIQFQDEEVQLMSLFIKRVQNMLDNKQKHLFK